MATRTIRIQPGSYAGKDTQLYSAGATSNFGSQDRFHVGEQIGTVATYRSLVKFDLAAALAPYQPIRSLTAATLRLTTVVAGTTYASSAPTINVYRCLRDWVESEATWNVYRAGNNWGVAGCNSAGVDLNVAVLGTNSPLLATPADTVLTFPLTAATVEQMANGDLANYGFVIATVSELNDLFGFWSAEAGTPSKAPALDLTFTYSATLESLADSGAAINVTGAGDVAWSYAACRVHLTTAPLPASRYSGTPTEYKILGKLVWTYGARVVHSHLLRWADEIITDIPAGADRLYYLPVPGAEFTIQPMA